MVVNTHYPQVRQGNTVIRVQGIKFKRHTKYEPAGYLQRQVVGPGINQYV